MDNQKTFKTSNNILIRMQIVHLGKILFNLQFIAVAVMAASVISFIMPAIYYLFLIFIALLTLFIAFTNPAFTSLWTGGETLTKIADTLTQSWRYTIPIVAILAIFSIICLCFDKNQKHHARILVSTIIAILAIIVLLLKFINTGVIK